MNEIQQYRKDSAEWMGFRIEKFKDEINVYLESYTAIWHPDQYHNQMHMMIDKLKKDGAGYKIMGSKAEGDVFKIFDRCDLPRRDVKMFKGHDKDIRIAFMKAWSEYYKQTKWL